MSDIYRDVHILNRRLGQTEVKEVPFSVRPAFFAHKNGSNQAGVVTATYTKVTFGTELFDINSNFASDRFTPTVAGRYKLVAAVSWLVAVDQAYIITAIFKNGSAIAQSVGRASGVGDQGPQVVADVDANGTTDYFEVYAYHSFGVNSTIVGGATVTYFSGALTG